MMKRISSFLLALCLATNVFAATISSINDLTDLGSGVYQINFQGTPNGGFVTSDNSLNAPLWYTRATYEFGSDWDWGYSEYDNSFGRYLANNKIVRYWNAGPTKENCYIEFTAREGNGTFKFACEKADGNLSFNQYFGGSNWKDVFARGTKHTMEAEFKENSYFKMWINGQLIGNITGFTSNTTGIGKRISRLGIENEWNSGTKRAPNTFKLSGILMLENKTREQAGSVPPSSGVPTPTPTVTPTPCPPCAPCQPYPNDFKAWWNSRPASLKGDLQ